MGDSVSVHDFDGVFVDRVCLEPRGVSSNSQNPPLNVADWRDGVVIIFLSCNCQIGLVDHSVRRTLADTGQRGRQYRRSLPSRLILNCRHNQIPIV